MNTFTNFTKYIFIFTEKCHYIYLYYFNNKNKLLTNKKLTEKQKQQYLKKIESIKVKIEKQNKTDKINKCKEHIINLRKTLKNKNITESQKQQCHYKIKN